MKKIFTFFLSALLASVAFTAYGAAVDSDGMPIFYLRGNFGNNSWNFQDSYKFTRSGNVYSLTINRFNSLGNCEFKISNDDWTINYGADETVTTSRYVDGVFDGPNMKTPGLTNAVISFTYNEDSPVKTSIKFVVDGVEPEPGLEPEPGTYPDVYLRGNFNNTGWVANDNYKFSRIGDVYTLNITASNPIEAGSNFKIGTANWEIVDLGGQQQNITIDNSQTITLTKSGANLSTLKGISDGSISFTFNPESIGLTNVKFTIAGTVTLPHDGISGTLPVLYINVYTDDTHTVFNNEVISKDLSHKNYFEFANYWLDTNGCEWLEELGAENVGSEENPLPLQIKARGNWTRIGFSKKPFKLKLDKKQSLLGLSKSKHFAILAHADDNKGYLRNFVGFELGKRIGLPWTPSQQPVEVVINGNYRGLYFLTESIRVDEDRVDITELGDNVSDPKLVSGGYIVELDNYNEDDNAQIRMEEKHCAPGWHNYDLLRVTFDTPEVYSDLQRRFITDQFTAMNDYVGANDNKLWSYIDLDDAARYYIVEEIVSHVESYHGSTYLFRDAGADRKWHFSPLWDFGNAFNGYTDDFFYNCDPYGNTWIPSMRENAKFNDKVKETWLWFMANEYAGLEQDIEEYVGHLTAAAQADYKRWNGQPVPSGGQPVADNRDMQGRKNEVLAHLGSKINWLKNQFGDYSKGTFSEPLRDTTPAAALPDYVDIPTDVVDAVEFDVLEGVTEIYNLQGFKVSNPQPGGIYILIQGNKARKIFIK